MVPALIFGAILGICALVRAPKSDRGKRVSLTEEIFPNFDIIPIGKQGREWGQVQTEGCILRSIQGVD
jgi:hypothetical protein